MHLYVEALTNNCYSAATNMANPETTDPCADPELFFGRGGVRAILCFPEGPISGKFKM